jgi:hypothetical protein
MNMKRVLLATLAGWVIFFVYGGLVFGMMLASDYRPFTNVFRSQSEMQQHMAIGVLSSLAAIIVLAVMYAKGYEGASKAPAALPKAPASASWSRSLPRARTSPTTTWCCRSAGSSRPRWHSQPSASGRWWAL